MQKTNILRYINMKVLSNTGASQTMKVIPREYVTDATLEVTDDTTNTKTTYNLNSMTTSGDELNVAVAFSPVLKEDTFYDMVLKKTDGKVIYKDKIFCTNQSTNQTANEHYTINSGVYTSDTSYDDDYIVL